MIISAIFLGAARKALADHVDNEDKKDGVTIRDSIGREQNPVIINESGMYSLVLSSKLEGAKRFKRWVTSEILPSIRKTGAYATDSTTGNIGIPPCVFLFHSLPAILTSDSILKSFYQCLIAVKHWFFVVNHKQ